MRTSAWQPLAFCMAVLVLLGTFPAVSLAAEEANMARYRHDQAFAGAKKIPVLAQLEYKHARRELANGNIKEAENHLYRALDFNPNFADAYFTLAHIELRRFSIDSAIYFIQAFRAIWYDFPTLRLLALNTVLMIAFVLMLTSLIVCLALAIKYLPFAAHRTRELLQDRFRAQFPGAAAYLLLLLPLVLLPGIITTLAYVIIVGWLFMRRLEKLTVISLALPFIALGLFQKQTNFLGPIADPQSLTSLIAKSNDAPGDANLIRLLERKDVEGLESEKHLAIGLLHLRAERFDDASSDFFRSASLNPDQYAAYINLGNVHFLRGDYEKSLEGYRKAVSIAPADPIGHYNLAQAYIGTLLMKESSKSLLQSSKLGIDKVKQSYAEDALRRVQVFPTTFSNEELWRMARVEGQTYPTSYLGAALNPYTRFSQKIGAWILIGAILIAILLRKIVDVSKVTFQCSNCGQLTCSRCCDDSRETSVCRQCAAAIEGVTSEKVIDALLRQKRQAVLVKRRKSARFVTMIVPGVRDVYYGSVSRGLTLAMLFSFAVIQLLSRGFIYKNVVSMFVTMPLWKLLVPAAGIVLTYLISIFSKQTYDLKVHRSQSMRHRPKDGLADQTKDARIA